MRRLFWLALLLLALLSLATLFLNYGLLPQAWSDLFASTGDGALLTLLAPDEPGAKADPSGPAAAAPEGRTGSDMEALSASITAGAAGEYERMAAIYDWVTANFAYDLEKAKDMEAYGAGAAYLLEKGRGVCQDFAELTRQLLEAAVIEATYESGVVYPAPGEEERHAWNLALAGGTWYGLDTTWGAGFIDEERGTFVQKPRRLYLTSPAELERLHGYPHYKEAKEQEYMRRQSAAAEPVFRPDVEESLLNSFNRYRAAQGLPSFAAEKGLVEMLRQQAARIAARGCSGEEDASSLAELEAELSPRAAYLRFARAGMAAFIQWSLMAPDPGELFEQIAADQALYLNEAGFNAVSIGVVSQGDLTVVLHVYLERY